MVIYDFCCRNGHTFEGWFGSLEECTRQQEGGMVRCPMCDTQEVERQLAAPAVHVHREWSKTTRPATPMAQTQDGRQTALRAMVHALRHVIRTTCEDVGAGFAQEAIAIHDGEADERNIVGTATQDEEEMLTELGVAYQKIALPRFDD